MAKVLVVWTETVQHERVFDLPVEDVPSDPQVLDQETADELERQIVSLTPEDLGPTYSVAVTGREVDAVELVDRDRLPRVRATGWEPEF